MSVTAKRPSRSRAIFFTPGRGAPECSEPSVVPAGQWDEPRRHMAPDAERHLFDAADHQVLVVVAVVITTRRISSIELGKSESQPPVPKPTWPNTSR